MKRKEQKTMSQRFGHIEPIKSEGYNNNDISGDNLIKYMVGQINGKRKSSSNYMNDNNKNSNKKENNNNKNNINKEDNKKRIGSERNPHKNINLLNEKDLNNKLTHSHKESPTEKEKEHNSKKIGGKGVFKSNLLNILEKKNNKIHSNEDLENNNNSNKNNDNDNNNNTKNQNDQNKILKSEEKQLTITNEKPLNQKDKNKNEIKDDKEKNIENKNNNPSINTPNKEHLLSIDNTSLMKHIYNPSAINTQKEYCELEPKELEESSNNLFSINNFNTRTNRSNSLFIPNDHNNILNHNKISSKLHNNPLIQFNMLHNNKKDNKNDKNEKIINIDDFIKNSHNDNNSKEYDTYNMKTEENKNNDDDYFQVKMKNNNNTNINNINNAMMNNNKNNKIFYQNNTFRHSKQSNNDKNLNKHNNTLSLNTKINTNDDKVMLSNNEEYLNSDKKGNAIRTVNSMRAKKPLKIIEQIKKENKECNEINESENKKRNSDYNINPYIRTQNNKNEKKNKSKQIFNQLISSSPKQKMNTTENKNILKTSPNRKSSNRTKKKSSQTLNPKFIVKNNNNKDNNNNNKDNNNNNKDNKNNKDNNNEDNNNEDEKIFQLLKEKYVEYLKRTFDGNIPKITKEEEKLNEALLRNLAKKELPIENENLDNIKCSNDMKAFLIESINNFKLVQMKDKMNENNGNQVNNIHQKFDPAKSNLIGLIYLDYENENKDSHMFEPIELEKSYFNGATKKNLVDSFKSMNQNYHNQKI